VRGRGSVGRCALRPRDVTTQIGQAEPLEAAMQHAGDGPGAVHRCVGDHPQAIWELSTLTGPQPPGALQAAHLYLYSANPEHDLRGGLLLRCDLHALFDRWLITIDPSTWSIEIAPELKRYPGLAELGGRAIQLPEDLRPRLKYIQEHAALAHASWR